jgi:DNA end-binding protein Ku
VIPLPRSIWKGVISFGMVAIPIRLYLARDGGKSVSFRLLCPDHKTPIKNKRWCPSGDHEVQWNDVLRGYEYEKDSFVVLTDEDLQNLPLRSSRSIDISGFIDEDELPGAVYYENAYYLEPDKVAAKPYALLKKALEDTNRVALAKVAFRDREHLASLRAQDSVLLMNTLYWPDEIRDSSDLDIPDVKVSPKELDMAKSLIDAMATSFDPSEYTDEYREALTRVVEAKREGQEVVVAEREREATVVVDLMSTLRASVEAAKKRQTEEKPAARGRSGAARKRAAS